MGLIITFSSYKKTKRLLRPVLLLSVRQALIQGQPLTDRYYCYY